MTEQAPADWKARLAAGSAWMTWTRPPLPDLNKGMGLGWGNFLIVLGFALVVVPFAIATDVYGAGGGALALAFLVPLGTGMIGLGIFMVAVCLVLREIRQAAFEAALRAGEVEFHSR